MFHQLRSYRARTQHVDIDRITMSFTTHFLVQRLAYGHDCVLANAISSFFYFVFLVAPENKFARPVFFFFKAQEGKRKKDFLFFYISFFLLLFKKSCSFSPDRLF